MGPTAPQWGPRLLSGVRRSSVGPAAPQWSNHKRKTMAGGSTLHNASAVTWRTACFVENFSVHNTGLHGHRCTQSVYTLAYTTRPPLYMKRVHFSVHNTSSVIHEACTKHGHRCTRSVYTLAYTTLPPLYTKRVHNPATVVQEASTL